MFNEMFKFGTISLFVDNFSVAFIIDFMVGCGNEFFLDVVSLIETISVLAPLVESFEHFYFH